MPPSAEPVCERSGCSLETTRIFGSTPCSLSSVISGERSSPNACRQAGRSGADDHRIIHIFQTFRTHGFDSRTPAEQPSSRVMEAD